MSARRIDKEMCLSLLRSAKLISDGDPEAGHGQADEAIIAFLRHLGHDDVTVAWEQVEKWYA